MRGLKVTALLLITIYVLSAAGFCIWHNAARNRHSSARNVAVNRINAEISSANTEPEDTIKEHFPEWQETYGEYCPGSIVFMPLRNNEHDIILASSGDGAAVCALYRGEELIGAVSYGADARNDGTVIAAVCLFGICFAATAAAGVYVYLNILKPFRKLTDYPERLARMDKAEKLPESRNKYFGKYIWGMNMLADRLEKDRRRISEAEYKRQTLLSSIAHGVKTPVANIKLYASAIMTGLYSGTDNDAAIAEKIEGNAEKISRIVSELMETSSSSVSSYEPETEGFYLSELRELILKEWSGRLEISRIPFTVECRSDAVINSDKWGLFRVISQLIENAVKYGDGTGISILIQHDDGVCITVRNKGELLPEKEIPYIFKSFWRGSNASDKEGSGIGLFTAHDTIRKLGGTIAARRIEGSSEMEFLIYFEE